MLQERQREYKKAALDAKTHDDRELALKYLRVSKGMDAMINAASNGLPVDISQVRGLFIFSCVLFEENCLIST